MVDLSKGSLPVTIVAALLIAVVSGMTAATGVYIALNDRLTKLEGADDKDTKLRLKALEDIVNVGGVQDWNRWRATVDGDIKALNGAAAGMANDIAALEKTQQEIQRSLATAGNERFRLSTRITTLETRQ